MLRVCQKISLLLRLLRVRLSQSPYRHERKLPATRDYWCKHSYILSAAERLDHERSWPKTINPKAPGVCNRLLWLVLVVWKLGSPGVAKGRPFATAQNALSPIGANSDQAPAPRWTPAQGGDRAYRRRQARPAYLPTCDVRVRDPQLPEYVDSGCPRRKNAAMV
jgi:hypothetical protein